MDTKNSDIAKAGSVSKRAARAGRSAALPTRFSYCSATDELKVSTDEPGEGEEDDLGQGLRITWDRTDGRFLSLKLRNVRAHLGARPGERLVIDPKPGLPAVEFDPEAGSKDLVVRSLIRMLIGVAGLRVWSE